MEKVGLSIEQKSKEWLAAGFTNKQIDDELSAIGIEEAHRPAMLKEITRLRNAQKTTKGLIYILIGAVLCLASCVMTLMLPQSNTTIVLYGLTSIGIITVFIGLKQIF